MMILIFDLQYLLDEIDLYLDMHGSEQILFKCSVSSIRWQILM